MSGTKIPSRSRKFSPTMRDLLAAGQEGNLSVRVAAREEEPLDPDPEAEEDKEEETVSNHLAMCSEAANAEVEVVREAAREEVREADREVVNEAAKEEDMEVPSETEVQKVADSLPDSSTTMTIVITGPLLN